MTRNPRWIFAFALMAVCGSRANAACGRECLVNMMTRYLNAVIAQDPSTLPLALKIRSMEDGSEIKLGDTNAIYELTNLRIDGLPANQFVNP